MKNLLTLIFLISLISINYAYSQSSKERTSASEKKAQRLVESKPFTAFNLTDVQKIRIISILVSENNLLDSIDIVEKGVTAKTVIAALERRKTEIKNGSELKIMAEMNEGQKEAYIKYAQQRNVAAEQPRAAGSTPGPIVIRGSGLQR